MSCRIVMRIKGSAERVSLHVINEEILDRLMNATIDDALYEDNPITWVADISNDFLRVTQGFCIDKINGSDISLQIDGKEIEIEAVGMLEEGSDFEETFQTDRNSTLFARTENSEILGEKLSIKSDEMFVLEFEDIKYGELTCFVDYPSKVAITDIELGVVVLNSDTEASRATNNTSFLGGNKFDIRYLIINGEKHELEMAVHNGYSSEFYLMRKINGVWKSEYLSIDVDEDDEDDD